MPREVANRSDWSRFSWTKLSNSAFSVTPAAGSAKTGRVSAATATPAVPVLRSERRLSMARSPRYRVNASNAPGEGQRTKMRAPSRSRARAGHGWKLGGEALLGGGEAAFGLHLRARRGQPEQRHVAIDALEAAGLDQIGLGPDADGTLIGKLAHVARPGRLVLGGFVVGVGEQLVEALPILL